MLMLQAVFNLCVPLFTLCSGSANASDCVQDVLHCSLLRVRVQAINVISVCLIVMQQSAFQVNSTYVTDVTDNRTYVMGRRNIDE